MEDGGILRFGGLECFNSVRSLEGLKAGFNNCCQNAYHILSSSDQIEEAGILYYITVYLSLLFSYYIILYYSLLGFIMVKC